MTAASTDRCSICGATLPAGHTGRCPNAAAHAALTTHSAHVARLATLEHGEWDGTSTAETGAPTFLRPLYGPTRPVADTGKRWAVTGRVDTSAWSRADHVRRQLETLSAQTRRYSVPWSDERCLEHRAELRRAFRGLGSIYPDLFDGGAYGVGQRTEPDGTPIEGSFGVQYVRAVAQPADARAAKLPVVPRWRTGATADVHESPDGVTLGGGGGFANTGHASREHTTALVGPDGLNMTVHGPDGTTRVRSVVLTAEGAAWLHMCDGNPVPRWLVKLDRRAVVGSLVKEPARTATVKAVAVDWDCGTDTNGRRIIRTRVRQPLTHTLTRGRQDALGQSFPTQVDSSYPIPHTARTVSRRADNRTTGIAPPELVEQRTQQKSKLRTATAVAKAVGMLEAGEIVGRSHSTAVVLANAALVMAPTFGQSPSDFLLSVQLD